MLLPVQSLHAWHFERPKLKISEFAARKVLLIRKASTEKMRDLVISILRKYEVQAFFMSREGKMGEARGDWQLQISGHQQGSEEDCASWCDSGHEGSANIW